MSGARQRSEFTVCVLVLGVLEAYVCFASEMSPKMPLTLDISPFVLKAVLGAAWEEEEEDDTGR